MPPENVQPQNAAENIAAEKAGQEAAQPQDQEQTQDDAENGEDNAESRTDSVVKDLQDKLINAQNKQDDLETQVEKLKAENAKLKKGSVKELSKADKESEKDKQIADLNAKIERMQAMNDTDTVFKENGLNVSREILEMVVTNDAEQTVANAKSLIDFIENAKSEARKESLKGTTPKLNKGGRNAIAAALGLK